MPPAICPIDQVQRRLPAVFPIDQLFGMWLLAEVGLEDRAQQIRVWSENGINAVFFVSESAYDVKYVFADGAIKSSGRPTFVKSFARSVPIDQLS